MEENFLDSTRKLFNYYRQLGEKSIAQCSFKALMSAQDEHNNSIAILVKHLAGNMRSRWTNFLTEDGEKPWRNRDQEFEVDYPNKAAIIADWNSGWDCLFEAINPLTISDVSAIVHIRNQGHTVVEALQRQLGHYACLLYTSPSPRDGATSRMPSSA